MGEEISVIKSDEQYRTYLAELETLIADDPVEGSAGARRLELLALVIETFEKKNFDLPKASPLDVIAFRLDQMGLKQSDLSPMIGAKGRVSEVMTGKRKLTLPMIRNISQQLRIPVDLLISEDHLKKKNSYVPLERELIRRGWIDNGGVGASSPEEFVSNLWKKLGVREVERVYFKKSLNVGVSGLIDVASVHAWVARVIVRARDDKSRFNFNRKNLSEDILKELPRLSWFENGPILAKQYLAKLGIVVVVEDHLPGTGIDGASTIDVDGIPLIGLTLRHDRLDNFWFTLMHECVHIIRHLRDPGDVFVDDVESSQELDDAEVEANRVARDSLIPPAAWRASVAPKLKTPEAVKELADELRISPSIVAGRIRRETGNYKLLTSLIGHRCVSKYLRPGKE